MGEQARLVGAQDLDRDLVDALGLAVPLDPVVGNAQHDRACPVRGHLEEGEEFLGSNHEASKTTLIFIDESQRLSLDTLELVRALGCARIQGYIFSRPVSGATVRAMLGEGRKRAAA